MTTLGILRSRDFLSGTAPYVMLKRKHEMCPDESLITYKKRSIGSTVVLLGKVVLLSTFSDTTMMVIP